VLTLLCGEADEGAHCTRPAGNARRRIGFRDNGQLRWLRDEVEYWAGAFGALGLDLEGDSHLCGRTRCGSGDNHDNRECDCQIFRQHTA
jgi:hypothetical protein